MKQCLHITVSYSEITKHANRLVKSVVSNSFLCGGQIGGTIKAEGQCKVGGGGLKIIKREETSCSVLVVNSQFCQ